MTIVARSAAKLAAAAATMTGAGAGPGADLVCADLAMLRVEVNLRPDNG